MRSSLSVDAGDSDENDTDSATSHEVKPLDLRIVEVIESIPDRTIRPGRLASDLGISIEDASAELCGLLAAVGGGTDGATFRFEKSESSSEKGSGLESGSVLTMVFTFPSNFRSRALSKRRRDDWSHYLDGAIKVGVKALKVITAAGLILSLLIVSIVLIAGFIAALIALSRGGGDRRQHSALVSQIHRIIILVRQLLWCYALFGPSVGPVEDGGGGQDPFLREVAYDLWLVLSVCCGNPASIFYWIRASELNRRRNRSFRSWGGARTGNNHPTHTYHGVTILSQNNQEEESFFPSGSTVEQRGLLNVAVEFLFGPTPFEPGPSNEDIWKLRASFIIERSTKNRAISLNELAPYIDYPPKQIDESVPIVTQCLSIISFFNGVPVQFDDNNRLDNGLIDQLEAKFIFPELNAESTVASRFDRRPDQDDGTWASFLYASGRSNNSGRSYTALPTYLKEERYRFTKLTFQELMHCIILGSLNLIGVVWVGQLISAGGVLDVTRTPLDIPLRQVLYPILRFYAVLFFSLPAGRFVLVLVLNSMRKERNLRRARLVQRTFAA